MAVCFAALGTTIYVVHNQSYLTHKIRKVAEEQQSLLSDTRNFYASAFVRVIQKISNRYNHVISICKNPDNVLSNFSSLLKISNFKTNLNKHIILIH